MSEKHKSMIAALTAERDELKHQLAAALAALALRTHGVDVAADVDSVKAMTTRRKREE